MSRRARWMVAVGALLMLLGYVTPLWRIQLLAPQYPEGLGLRIWVNQVRGASEPDLNSINNLNHYIGMQRIEPGAIPELRYMPWILGGLIATGLLVAVLGRRKLLLGWVVAASIVALAGLADFWKWGYDYGHELDPHAIIKISGMSYQPPLIGSKQLLNFHATSWPDIGGWAIVAALALAAAALVMDRRGRRRAAAAAAAVSVAAMVACSPGPRAIHYGEDVCAHCHMPVSDPRFAGQLVAVTGKVYVFDDVGCLAAFATTGPVQGDRVHSIVVNSFVAPDSTLDATRAVYLRSDSLHTPMASGLAALRPGPEADSVQARLGGTLLSWEQVLAEADAPAAAPTP